MKTPILVTFIIAIIAIGGLFVINNQSTNKTTPQNGTASPSAEVTKAAQTFTVDDVKKHNTAQDCWLILHSKVYDVTTFIPNHPGGKVIISSCGTDATAQFEQRPGDGSAHSETARQMSEQFYIGDLK